MKKIMILVSIMISFNLLGLDLVAESVENYSSCGSSQNDLSYSHDTVDLMIPEWESKGHNKVVWYKDSNTWATDLMDNDLCSGCGTDNYTDNVSDMLVISGHGGILGTSTTNMWSTTALCSNPSVPYYYNGQGNYMRLGEPDQNNVFSKASYLVLFTCLSVHDFVKDNSYVMEHLRNGATWNQWDYPLRKNLYTIYDTTKPKSRINMIFGFAGVTIDTEYDLEGGKDFIEDMDIESQKIAWFTGNEYYPTNNRVGVITWGDHYGRYGINSATDARGRRDNHKLTNSTFVHGGDVALAWSHHDC